MRPTDQEIIRLLKSLVHESMLHNAEYHHKTPDKLLKEALQTIDKLEQNLT